MVFVKRHVDWLVVLAASWLAFGGWLDAWSHHKTELETFFTPAHGVLYAGYLATASVLILGSLDRRNGSIGLRPPPGYSAALAGAALFAVGGVGDLIWHMIFGIEEDIDALLSPTHLLLGIGALLMASGPVGAAVGRSHDRRAAGQSPVLDWPAAISLALITSSTAFFTAFANPFALPFAAGERITELVNFGVRPGVEGAAPSALLSQALGAASLFILIGMLMSVVLFAVLSWRLPLGAFTVMFVIGIGTSALPHESVPFLGVALVGGLVADGLFRTLRPSLERPAAVVWFALLVPVALTAAYFGTIALITGIAWPVELWTGSILLSGGIGVALSAIFISVGSGRNRHPGEFT